MHQGTSSVHPVIRASFSWVIIVLLLLTLLPVAPFSHSATATLPQANPPAAPPHAPLQQEAPISGLAVSQNGPVPLGSTVTLTATVATGTNVQYVWDLGDGTTASGAVVRHTYAATGTFTVRVEASNASATNPVVGRTQVVVNPAAPVDEVPLTAVPLELHRRAAQFLEEWRQSSDPDMGGAWQEGQLAPVVRPLYRPDIATPAYYEFVVLAPQAPTGALSPTGYILLATTDHDYPLPAWSFTGQSPTNRMADEARQQGQQAVRFYKLDMLTYYAENAAGESIPVSGTRAPKIEGYDPAWLDIAPEDMPIAEFSWTQSTTPTDSETPQAAVEPTLVATGTEQIDQYELTYSEWESWDALKAGYAETYAVPIAWHRRDAQVEWALERTIERDGIILQAGEVYDLVLLGERGSTHAITGAATSLVTTSVITPASSREVLRIAVADTLPQNTQASLEVGISYTDSQTETVRFLIVDTYSDEFGVQAPPQNQPHRVYLPLVLGSATGSTKASALQLAAQPTAPRMQASWSDWTVFWADGGDAWQRFYSQIPGNTGFNTDKCVSGCGATAWAMLFGWGDRAAYDEHPVWKIRKGLYRTDGKVDGSSSALAPRRDRESDGDRIEGPDRMKWEIRNHMKGYCAGTDYGVTLPHNMYRAQYYLNPRTGATISTKYNALSIPTNNLRNIAIDHIANLDRPVVVGTGYYAHYPLAYGYARRTKKTIFGTQYDRRFYLNQGWNEYGNGWYAGKTWFVGRLNANP